MKRRTVWDEMREEQSREFWGMLAFMAFLTLPIAAGVVFGWLGTLAVFGAIFLILGLGALFA